MKIDYSAYQQELADLRRHFHMWPEVSMEEKETANYVVQYLEKMGLHPERVGENGVTAMVWAPEGVREHCKTVAVRAEMDALPVQEQTGAEWKSKKTESCMPADTMQFSLQVWEWRKSARNIRSSFR